MEGVRRLAKKLPNSVRHRKFSREEQISSRISSLAEIFNFLVLKIQYLIYALFFLDLTLVTLLVRNVHPNSSILAVRSVNQFSVIDT
jgi:hypothetical protein